MTTLTQHINAWIAKRRAHRVKLAVDTLIIHHVRNDPELTHRIATTAPNCVFNDRPIGDMVVITQPADRSLSAISNRVAKELIAIAERKKDNDQYYYAALIEECADTLTCEQQS